MSENKICTIISQPNDGLIIRIIELLLFIPSIPFVFIHKKYKILAHKLFLKILPKTWGLTIIINKEKVDPIDGVSIEIWSVICLICNFILLYLISTSEGCIKWVYFLPVFLRLSDIVKTEFLINFYLLKQFQRSLARSYNLLIQRFIEIAIIFSSVCFMVTSNFQVVNDNANWFNVLKYSLLNMFTVNYLKFSCYQTNTEGYLFDIISVLQPFVGILFIAMAIGRIIDENKK